MDKILQLPGSIQHFFAKSGAIYVCPQFLSDHELSCAKETLPPKTNITVLHDTDRRHGFDFDPKTRRPIIGNIGEIGKHRRPWRDSTNGTPKDQAPIRFGSVPSDNVDTFHVSRSDRQRSYVVVELKIVKRVK